MKTLQHSTLIRVTAYGGLIVLAASIWAWAIGVSVWYGVIPGVVLGLAAGFLIDGIMEGFEGAGDLAGLGRFAIGSWIILFFLALSIVGAIVGVVLRFIWLDGK